MQRLTTAEIEHVKAITNTGELYYDYDPLIEQARNYAYAACRQFNQAYLTQEPHYEWLQALFATCGTNFTVGYGFITEFGFNLHIGNNFHAGKNLKIIDCNRVVIGDNVTLGNNVGIYTSNHAFDAEKRAQHWCSELPITIGDNTIIETGCTIVPGTAIGSNCLIKAGSVVRATIADNTIVSGVPAH